MNDEPYISRPIPRAIAEHCAMICVEMSGEGDEQAMADQHEAAMYDQLRSHGFVLDEDLRVLGLET